MVDKVIDLNNNDFKQPTLDNEDSDENVVAETSPGNYITFVFGSFLHYLIHYYLNNTEPKQLIAEAPRRSVSAKPLTTRKSIAFTIDTPQPERPPISTTATAFTIDTPEITTIPRALTSHRRSIRDR